MFQIAELVADSLSELGIDGNVKVASAEPDIKENHEQSSRPSSNKPVEEKLEAAEQSNHSQEPVTTASNGDLPKPSLSEDGAENKEHVKPTLSEDGAPEHLKPTLSKDGSPVNKEHPSNADIEVVTAESVQNTNDTANEMKDEQKAPSVKSSKETDHKESGTEVNGNQDAQSDAGSEKTDFESMISAILENDDGNEADIETLTELQSIYAHSRLSGCPTRAEMYRSLAQSMCERLVQSALLAGSRDNITAMVILLPGCKL